VTDFAPEPLTLEARGDVSLESEGGSVRGNRMVLHGLDDLRIEGLPDALAHLRSTRGEWFALRVQRVGPTMIAEGVERAIFSDAGAHYELTCDRMTATRRSPLRAFASSRRAPSRAARTIRATRSRSAANTSKASGSST
jgi:hypothetical protein